METKAFEDMRIKNLNIFPLKEQNILLENNLEVDDNGSLNLSKIIFKYNLYKPVI